MLVRTDGKEGMKLIRYFMSLFSFWPALLSLPIFSRAESPQRLWLPCVSIVLLSLFFSLLRYKTSIRLKEKRTLRINEFEKYTKGLRLYQALICFAILLAVLSDYHLALPGMAISALISKRYNLYVFNPLLAMAGYEVSLLRTQSTLSGPGEQAILLITPPQTKGEPGTHLAIALRLSERVYLTMSKISPG